MPPLAISTTQEALRRPQRDGYGWKPGLTEGDAAGLLSGLLSGAAITSVRRLQRTESSVWIVIFFTAISSIIAFPLMAPRFVVPDGTSVVFLVLIALLSTAAQLWMTAAYRRLRTVEGGTLSLGTVPISAILAMIILHEYQPPRFWVGAALVFAATVVLQASGTAGGSARN